MEPLWLFALLVAGIIALPGMDMAIVLSSALVDGRRGGAAAVAGIVAGGLAHVALGMLGIGLLLQLAPKAFNTLLLAGAAYVAWMGVGLWREPGALVAVPAASTRPAHRTFWRALATCLLNPKAYVFMVAVFPQFLRPDGGPLALQALVLWAVIAAHQLAIYGAVALGAQRLRAWLAASTGQQQRLARIVAGLLLATAAWTAWQGWQR
jgi:threonine/homoserine/homoserine lactone efflux protein